MGQQPNIVLIMTDPQRADLLAAIARWTICLTDVLPAPSANGRYKLKLDPHNYTQA